MKTPFSWKISTAARITLGLIGLLVSVLMLISLWGLFPDSRVQLMRDRIVYCESAAAGFSLMAEKASEDTMRAYLETLARRNPDVQSLGVRRTDGSLVLEAGNHPTHWDSSESEPATESQIGVRFYAAGEPWGTFEAAFPPPERNYLAAFRHGEIVHGLVAAILCLFAFYVYLRIVLRHLDPSRVISRCVRDALNSLAEGLLILDRNERIVLSQPCVRGIDGNRITAVSRFAG